MYMIRDILHCRPGKVRPLVDKFKAVSQKMEDLGFQPMRIFTDASGERFWTVVLQFESPSMNDYMEMEANIMSNPEVGKLMAGYHELVESGRREIYRIES